MPENESKTSKEIIEHGSKALVGKNAKIKDFFKNLRSNISEKTKGTATEVLAYLKALETVAINSPVVGAEMIKRGLGKVKSEVDARVDRFAKEAEISDKKLEKAAEKRKKETKKKEDKESKHTRTASKAKKLDDKLTDTVAEVQSIDEKTGEALKNISDVSETKSKEEPKTSKAEKTSRKIKTDVVKAAIKGARTIGRGLTYINPNSKFGMKAVTTIENVGKKIVSKDSKLAQKVEKVSESIGKKKEDVTSGVKKVGRTISNGVTISIGGAVHGVSTVGNRILSSAKSVKQGAKDVAEGVQEEVRTATKYISQAPERIENASRRGISNLLNGMAKNTQQLADKVYPKVEKKEIDYSHIKNAEAERV